MWSPCQEFFYYSLNFLILSSSISVSILVEYNTWRWKWCLWLQNKYGCLKSVTPFEVAFQSFCDWKTKEENLWRLGAEMWRKAPVEISDAFTHITMPFADIILILPLSNAKQETYDFFILFIHWVWLLDSCRFQSRCWVVEKSFCRIIRRFDPHHNTLADNLDIATAEC